MSAILISLWIVVVSFFAVFFIIPVYFLLLLMLLLFFLLVFGFVAPFHFRFLFDAYDYLNLWCVFELDGCT